MRIVTTGINHLYIIYVQLRGTMCIVTTGTNHLYLFISEGYHAHCEHRYRPRQGDAVLFWGTTPGSTDIDPHALHGGCPVTKGEKWVSDTE